MELDYLQLLTKDLNQVYKEVKFNKDYPYSPRGLAFLKTYSDLTNLFELKHFMVILEELNQTMKKDYRLYANETHHVFAGSYLSYRGTYQMTRLLLSEWKTPILTFDLAEEAKFFQLLSLVVEEQLGYLNYHYQELYLWLADQPFAPGLVKLLTNDFKQVFAHDPSLVMLVKLMAEFNNQQSIFINQIIRSNIKVDKLSDFNYDLKKVFYVFKPLLKIYFNWNLFNQRDEEVMGKYSASYLS